MTGQTRLCALIFLIFIPLHGFADNTLSTVKKNGFLKCGVSQGLPGFSNIDDKSQWHGIDVDVCRAIAAAIFADPNKVKFTPLSAKERFTALQSGEIDVLSRNTTWTITRDTALGLNFTAVTFYDGQGFMVRKDLGVTSAKELDGATLCAQTGTTTELNAADYFRSNKLNYHILPFEKADETLSAYDAQRCDVYTTDVSGLYAQRTKLKEPQAHVILSDVISKEPLGPAVRQGDDQWANIVRWTLFAMLNGEELGLDSNNIARYAGKNDNPAINRFVGLEGDYGENMGLNDRWAYNIVRLVGNYSQVYERNLGEDSLLKIPRGLNRLWSDGGIQYAPPIR